MKFSSIFKKIRNHFVKRHLVQPIGSYYGYLMIEPDDYAKTKNNYTDENDLRVFEQMTEQIAIFKDGDLRPIVMYDPRRNKVMITSIENLEGHFIQ